MGYAYGCMEGLRQACHDIRQPIAGMLPSAGAALTEADLPDNARNRLKQVTRLAEWQSDMIEHWLWSPDARPSKTNTQMLLAVEDDGPGFRRLPKASASARQEWPARPSSTAEGLSAVEAASEQRGRACGCQWSCPGWKGGLPMRLVLCDENRIMSEALASVLQAHGHRVLAIATRASEAVAAVSAHQPDACLLDVRLPDGSGLDAARAMRRCHPGTKIVVLSCLNDPAVVLEAKKAGVAGFLCKDQRTDSIVRAVEVVGAGGMAFGPVTRRQQGSRMTAEYRDNPLWALTPRETEVLRRIVTGQSTGQMASEMDVTISTLRSYIKSILAKLGVHSRLQAAAIATASHHRPVA